MAPRETENNADAKFWGDKQRALWYVMVFSGVVNKYLPVQLYEEVITGVVRQVCGLRFTLVRLDHALVVSHLPQGSFHPKTSQSHVC